MPPGKNITKLYIQILGFLFLYVVFSYQSESLSTCILTAFYLQGVLTIVTYAHVCFSSPGIILYLSPILLHMLFIIASTFFPILWSGCSKK